MKTASILIAGPVAALAASIPRASQAVPSGPFALGAWQTGQNSGTCFHGTPVHASGLKFFINKPTSTYCPDGVSGLNCSDFSGTGTTFVMGEGSTSLSLDTTVPGGQQVYIGPDGSLSYTQAHSAAIPAGSTTTGFSRDQGAASDAPVYLSSANSTWFLCPVSEGTPTERAYQVIAASEQPEGCIATKLRTYAPEPGQVWQYA
ncbi:hypothetical protein F4777DRAFT_3308 [Nemania sp. FL0916]|nr:hypothetical protein F4777DRAFT_3308 [Nemania sp. FL0916]